MKLLYITNGINGSGGLERVLSIKASYLAEHYGYDITILSLNEGHIEPFYDFSDKIRMLSIDVEGNTVQYLYRYIYGIKRVFKQIKPDIVSVCDDGLKGFFVPLFLQKSILTIYERHASINLNFKRENSTFFYNIISKIQYRLMKQMAGRFDRFVVLTKGNLKEWSSQNLEVVANPLSFYPDEKSNHESKNVIAVGSHSFNKGYDLLLKAWLEVIKKHPYWKLSIYGKQDKDKSSLNLANELKIADSVTFFEPVSDIKLQYLSSSIMVLPSRSEGFGMVLIEAMACGLPCVSFDCPHGPADIIQEGVDGFIVENGNIEQLASKLITLIENKQLRINMGAQAKENVKRYLPKNIMKQWDELFKSLVK